MKTAEQRIDEIFTDWVQENQTLAQLERRIVQAVKEQDRDTRHACAEALLKLKRHGGEDESLVILHEAEAACMNVRAL